MDIGAGLDPADLPVEPQGMTDEQLATLLAAHEQRAVGYYNSEIADEQAKALNYYYGRMDDLPAPQGCSTAVEHVVAVMVDNALAAVLKPFVSADDVVSFDPRSEEDVEMAEQATEYVNYVINYDNPGFQIFHDWFKDGLLSKVGIVKTWWEDKTRTEVVYDIVDPLTAEMLMKSDEYLDATDNGDGTFTVSLQKTIPDGRCRIANVPPEEFRINPFARSIEDADYVAHTPSNVRRSDLIEMGFDPEVVASLPAFHGRGEEEARGQARYRDEEWFSGTRENIGNDKSRDIMALCHEFVRVDYDGDGVSELRSVMRVDDTILSNELADDIDFAVLCPVPMPHKVYGLALADQAIQSQKIATAILRQTLDNLYKSNNPRPIVGDRALSDDHGTMDALGDNTPGAVIPVGDTGQIDFLEVPFNAANSFPMLEYVLTQAEERTGIQRKGNGFDKNALKKNSVDTATEASIDEGRRNERAEMIARIFAETGVKRLFKLLLKKLVKYQPAERVVRLRNKWVPMDPRGWDAEMDVTIAVGLGVGNKADQMMQAQGVLDIMERLGQTPYAHLIDDEKVHAAIKRFFTATGIKNVDDFLNDPREDVDPQTGERVEREPPPDPETLKVQAEMQRDAAKLEMEREKAAIDMETRREEAALKLQLAREEAAAKLELERAKAAAEAQLAREQMAMEMELKREQMRLQAEVARETAKMKADSATISDKRPGGDLDK